MGNLLKKIFVVGAAILRGDRCLVAQRSASMSESLRWEFPGGKVEGNESPTLALVREIQEELGCVIRPSELLGQTRVLETNRELTLAVYEAKIEMGTPRALEHREIRWVDARELPSLDWAPADRPILPRLLSRLEASATGKRSAP